MMDKKSQIETGNESKMIEGQSFEMEGKEGPWHGQELGFKSDPLVDPGTGAPRIIRRFEFKRNPEFTGHLTNQEIFNSNWRQIRNTLWGDGLIANEEVSPRVVQTKEGYEIFVLCDPKRGTFVVNKPQTIQEIVQKPKKKT